MSDKLRISKGAPGYLKDRRRRSSLKYVVGGGDLDASLSSFYRRTLSNAFVPKAVDFLGKESTMWACIKV